MADKALEKAWRARLKAFSRSRQSVRGWCAEHDIPVHQFHYWRRRLADDAPRQPQPDNNWVAVVVTPEAPPVPDASGDRSGGVTIRMGQATIEVSLGFDPALLRAVVQSLESAPC